MDNNKNISTDSDLRSYLVSEYRRLNRELADEMMQEWMHDSIRIKRDAVQAEINAIDGK